MTMPRDGLRTKAKLFNNGSIKNDFCLNEEIEESITILPGPGHYYP